MIASGYRKGKLKAKMAKGWCIPKSTLELKIFETLCP